MFSTVDMRALYRSGNDSSVCRADELLARYYPLLQQAFPLEGEIETPETYRHYLCSKDHEWYLLVLQMDDKIVGGLQFRILRDVCSELPIVAWTEHIWLVEDTRNFPNFMEMLKLLVIRLHKDGVSAIFMEWNDPHKMTPEQIADDAKAGLLTNDRVRLWASRGIQELVDDEGTVVPYAQPGMDGQDPVLYLTAGWYLLGRKRITSISKAAYFAVLNKAHATIPGCDPETDPTCLAIRQTTEQLPGENLHFRPLDVRFPVLEQ